MSQRNSTNVVKSLYPQFKRILLTQILQVNKKVGGAKYMIMNRLSSQVDTDGQ